MCSAELNREKFLIPLEVIKQATNDFSQENKIGKGGFGLVYKGELSERWQNCTAAIKRSDPESTQGGNEFQNELKMMCDERVISHDNLISFIGYCDEHDEMIIVYEYATNGSLDRYLENQDKMRYISWEQRLKICLGAARGLQYLHSGLGEENRIIHRDVKSSNILLDDNMVAKVSDFGLSRSGPINQPHTEVHTRPAGTQFYLDPIYRESGILTRKSDVYSFGVVLFEILCGMPAYHGRRIGDNEPQTLIKLVRRYTEVDDEVEKIIDPHISHDIDGRSIRLFKDIAKKCISHNVDERPTMDRIIKTIEGMLEFQDNNKYGRKVTPTHDEFSTLEFDEMRTMLDGDQKVDMVNLDDYVDKMEVRPNSPPHSIGPYDEMDSKYREMPLSYGSYGEDSGNYGANPPSYGPYDIHFSDNQWRS